MKKRNIILGIVLSFTILILLTGCGSKKAITNSEFISKSKEHSYTITDVTSQYESYGVIKSATIAQSSNDWQVEFYVLNDENEAMNMFNTNKLTFESYESNVSVKSASSMGNYSSYTLTSSEYYMHLCRVDNTFLYVRVNDTYKNKVKDFIKELGY